MSAYQFANNASTTLGSSLSSSATTIVLATGSGAEFPNPAAGQFFTATLWAAGSVTGTPNEIVRVTSRSGDTLTIVRAQEGTTAQAWNVGDTIANYPTAAFYNQVGDDVSLQKQAGNYAVDTGTANAGVITLNPVPASLAALIGVPIRIKKQNAYNTGTYTLQVNGFALVQVTIGVNGIIGGELAPSKVYEVVYDGNYFNLTSPPAFINTQQLVNDSVTNAILAAVPGMTLKGDLTGSDGQPYDVPLSDVATALHLSSGWSATDSTTPGTSDITVPDGIFFADVIIIGGGGSGQGGFSNGVGGGGGAGGIAMGKVPVTPGSTIHRVVGAGGASPAASTIGNAGTASSLSGIGQATGGQGGGSISPVLFAGGYGGSGSSFGPYLRTFTGGDASDGHISSAGSTNLPGGNGAPGYLGMGGGRSGAGAGQPGVSAGAGGGGGYNGACSGGAGAPGAIFITWLSR